MNHPAIYDLYPQVISINGDIAYDKDGNIVEYDKKAVKNKFEELLTQEQTEEQAKIAAKKSALAKLMALGLTKEESLALGIN